MAGHECPSSHSDIQCGECLLYFRLDGDLIAHREEDHSEARPTSILRGVVSGGRFVPTSDWETL